MNEDYPLHQPARVTFITGLMVATVITLTVVTIVFAQDSYFAKAQSTESVSEAAKTVTAADLNTKTTSSLDVSVYSVVKMGDSTTIDPILVKEGDSTLVLYRDQYIGFQPITSLLGYYKRSTIVQITGRSQPNAVITLQFDAKSPSTKVTAADAAGAWRIDVNVDELKPGDYSATVKTSVDATVSDTMVVGTFSVGTKRIMSNTTWMIIMVSGSALIAVLLIANIAVFVSHRRQNRRAAARVNRV